VSYINAETGMSLMTELGVSKNFGNSAISNLDGKKNVVIKENQSNTRKTKIASDVVMAR
jgi:hypothetical protein